MGNERANQRRYNSCAWATSWASYANSNGNVSASDITKVDRIIVGLEAVTLGLMLLRMARLILVVLPRWRGSLPGWTNRDSCLSKFQKGRFGKRNRGE